MKRRDRGITEVYRRLLRLYPLRFRERFGASMISSFEAEYETCRKPGPIGAASFWTRTVWNTVWSALLEHLRQRRVGLASDPRTPGRFASGALADVRAAARSAAHSPRTSLAAIVCIALGTAATSAVLTLHASVVLRPLPFPDSERLVRVWLRERGTNERGALSIRDYEDLRDGVPAFDRFVATGRSRLMFPGEQGARRVEGEAVTDGYFELLGIRPLAGRFFTADEHMPGSDPVMVLSSRTWRDEFGGAAAILGSPIRTAAGTFTVVGVAPGSFPGTIEDDFPDIEYWVPLVHDRTAEERLDRTARSLWTIGRLSAGISVSAADEAVRALGERIALSAPAARADMELEVEPMGENWREALRSRSLALLLAAGLLLLVAATNTAGLLTSRFLDRRDEMAVRAALGAGRGRLARQTLGETLILTVTGTIIGTAGAPTLLTAFLSLAPEEVPAYMSIELDLRALALAAGVLVLTALVTGTIPTLVGARVDPAAALSARGTTQGRRERSLAEALIVAEVALTVVLLVGAGLLLRSYRAMGESDLGYRTARLLKMTLFVDTVDVDHDRDLPGLYHRIREELGADPGVDGIALVSPTAPPATGGETTIAWSGMPQERSEDGIRAHAHRVGPHFLATMEIPVLAGRGVRPGDADDPVPVAVVSESVAELLGGTEEALGREIHVGDTTHRIVGVAGDVLYGGPVFRRPRDLDVYVSLARTPSRVVSIVLSTRDDPGRSVGPMTERLGLLAPRSPVDWVDPMSTAISQHFQGPRFYLAILVGFAGSSLGLTAVGLFATLAGLVTKRRTEMGIRRALGAGRARLVRGVLLRGLAISGFGLAVGSVAAVATGPVFRSMLYGVGSVDPLIIVSSAALICVVAALASAIPATAAARVSPVRALQGP